MPSSSNVVDFHNERSASMMKKIDDETKTLNIEAKRLFREMEEAEAELAKAVEEAKGIRKKQQMKQLKGNELIKLDHLLRLGYDEKTVKDHLEKSVKQLKKETTKAEKEVTNTEQNIDKMISMNKEAEKAVTSAQQASTTIMVNRRKQQALLDNVEVELYAEESRVKHFQSVNGVEITKDNNSKQAIKHIIKLLITQSSYDTHDKKLIKDVRKVAEKAGIDLSDVLLDTSLLIDSPSGSGGPSGSKTNFQSSFVGTLDLSDSEANNSDDSSDVEISSASSSSSSDASSSDLE